MISRMIYPPGCFCVTQNNEMKSEGQRQLRISYGFEDIPELERAILLMRDAAEYVSQTAL